MSWLRGLTLLLIPITYAMVVLGGVVRVTNSGLSCPDWPTCYGHWLLTPADYAALPATGYTYVQIILEWGHRVLGGVVIGPLVMALVAGIALTQRRRPALVGGAAALLLLLLVQGALGGLTVLDRNSPWSVAIHLVNAMLVLSALLWLAVRLGPTPPAPDRPVAGVIAMATLVTVLGLGTLAAAAMTAKSGASLACSTWPLCNGQLVPPLDDPLVAIHAAHRALAMATGIAISLLAWATRGGGSYLARPAVAAFALVALQVSLGGLVIVWQVPPAVAALHQAVGVMVVATAVLVLWRAVRLRSVVPATRREGGFGLALRGA